MELFYSLLNERANEGGVACGASHSLLWTKEGLLYAMGSNEKGELGLGTVKRQKTPLLTPFSFQVKQVASGLRHALLLTKEGALYGTGVNNYGNLGLSGNETRFVWEPIILPLYQG